MSQWSTGWFGTGDTGPVNGMEEAGYSSSNVSVSGGTLNLTLDHSPVSVNGRSFPYTGAIVTSHFTFTYGYVEWEAYLPGAANGEVADWPALWLDGTGTWPTTGEDDVLEGLHGQAAAHFESPSGNPGVYAGSNYSGWHTFGVSWQPGITTYYYDGKDIGSITRGITGAPMYLIMDNTISGQSPQAASYPQVMRIAWVRVWS